MFSSSQFFLFCFSSLIAILCSYKWQNYNSFMFKLYPCYVHLLYSTFIYSYYVQKVTEYTDGRSIDLELLENDGTIPAQQHVANHNLADTQNTNTMDTTTPMTDTDLEKGMAHDITQTTMSQNPVQEEFEATFTFEAHADVTTTRTDRLPITSTHVLEEIAANQNIDGNVAAYDDTTAVAVQPVAHSSKNVQNDLDLWARICEYDQRMAEEGFTQVLSKS